VTAVWARPVEGALLVDVRVTPKTSADRVEGVHLAADGTERLAVKVRARPDGGEANAAVAALLARHFSVPKRSVAIASGATSRLKTVRIEGVGLDVVSGLPTPGDRSA
jgi:uncharacterized protein (TIGR00251 family)